MFEQPWDVVVIGGGNAALCAAICAREQGASVLMLEHAPRHSRGGNSRHTRNLRCMHEAANDFLTGPYLEDEYWDDLIKVTGGETNEEMARFTIRTSNNITDWMEDHGVKFQPALGGTLQLGRTNAFFRGGGKALVNAYFHTAEKLGVQVAYEAEVIDMDIVDGECKSVTVSTADGAEHKVTMKSLVVASGGFEANLDWLEEAWGPAAQNFIVRGTPFNKGKTLRLLIDKGAKPIGDPKQCHAVAIDARTPKYDGGISSRLDCVSLGIVVDKNAQRFYDEGEDFWPKRYAIWGRLVAQQEDQIAYSIIDDKSIELFMPSIFPPIKADSIEELAEKLELNPEDLKATVEKYNKAVLPGMFDTTVLDDCSTDGITPPKSHWARPIDTPPYYGYPLRPGITFTYLGVQITKQAKVLLNDNAESANIFAAGEIMAGNILGKGYLAGIGMTIGTVFGRIAGEEAARHAGK